MVWLAYLVYTYRHDGEHARTPSGFQLRVLRFSGERRAHLARSFGLLDFIEFLANVRRDRLGAHDRRHCVKQSLGFVRFGQALADAQEPIAQRIVVTPVRLPRFPFCSPQLPFKLFPNRHASGAASQPPCRARSPEALPRFPASSVCPWVPRSRQLGLDPRRGAIAQTDSLGNRVDPDAFGEQLAGLSDLGGLRLFDRSAAQRLAAGHGAFEPKLDPLPDLGSFVKVARFCLSNRRPA